MPLILIKGRNGTLFSSVDGSVIYCIIQGHDVNSQDYAGWTPLHEAANFGNLEIVNYLVTHGADIDHSGGEKCNWVTPLIDAASNGYVEVMRLLIKKGANCSHKDKMVSNYSTSLTLSYLKIQFTHCKMYIPLLLKM